MVPLFGGFRILPVNVDAIETEIFDELHAAGCKACSAGFSARRCCEVGRVRPAADREEHFEIAVLLLQKIELLKAAVQVCAYVVPRVTFPVDVCICPCVGEVARCRRVRMSGIVSRLPQGWMTYTSPVSGRTLANAYRTWVRFSTGRSCGLNLRA